MIKRLIQYALPLSVFLFAVLFVLLFPLYRFIFDQDTIGYSAVAQRVANADYYKSINGLWSPLSSWLAVPFIKAGINTITTFKIINAFIGIILLLLTAKLANRFYVKESLKAVLLYTCVPIFLSYCFYELCADFLMLLFFVSYLIQITATDFFENKNRIFIASIMAVFAYLAKAYFFPFFLLHFVLINFYYFKKSTAFNKVKLFFRNISMGIFTFLILCSGWIYALSAKYHYLTYSNTGKYNTYLHLHPGTEYSKILLTPPYADSFNSWEDPWLPFMQRFSAFSTSTAFIKQIKLFIANIFNAVPAFNEISFLALFIIAAVFFLAFKRIKIQIPQNIVAIAITASLMPVGYFLFHIETRFIWIESILCLIMGAYLIKLILDNFIVTRLQKMFLLVVFVISFLIGPLQSLKNDIYEGKETYTLAAALENNHIKGKIICNIVLDMNRYTQILMANVIAKNKFYNYAHGDFTTEKLLDATKEFDIDYYIFSYSTPFEKEYFLQSDLCKKATAIFTDIYPGIIALKLK